MSSSPLLQPRLRHLTRAVVADPTAEAMAEEVPEADLVAALAVAAQEVAVQEVAASPIAFSKRSATSVRISQAPAPVPVEAVGVLP